MKKNKYETPWTECVEVELENGFMNGSVVDEDVLNDSQITIESQQVGAESNYFDGENASQWDY